MSVRIKLVLLTVTVALGVGCSDSDPADVVTDCDPFAPHRLPITLGKLLGAGKDKQGTIYAADALADVEARVFVSSGKQLVRQRVAGAGSDGTGFNVFDVDDHDPAFVLQIEGVYPDSVRMGVLKGPLPEGKKMFTIGQDGEELTIVPKSAVTALSLRNLPGDVFLEYVDRLDDDRLLVVTRPQDDWAYEDFRVFLGPKQGLVERRLIEASRGNDTYITFDLDGANAEAFFPFSYTEDGGFGAGTPTLTVGGKSQDMVALDGRPAGAQYDCFAH